MPSYDLLPHPDYPPLAVRGVEVEVIGGTGDLRLIYRVHDQGRAVWPSPASPSRADELWRTTCFELFLLFDDDERYVEFNFSPSSRWAAYAFDAYRDGMTALAADQPPRVARIADEVTVACDLGGLPHGEHRMALTAVIEEEGGVKSYWSLAHPPGPPDFHHPACFAARLPAAGGA